jgi:prepilin-type N-terminal cleavage/methylation domain-containing protein
MKTELKVKFLQHLTQKKKDDEGFTLIELLVVIIIIGVLSAIALPSFLNQAAKARAAEAKSNVGSMNRAQQAYFIEHEQFTTNVPDLVINLDMITNNFSYSASPGTDGITAAITNFGTSQHNDIKSYAGGVFYLVGATTAGATTTILCEANTPGTTPVADPINDTDCGPNSKKIK